MKKGICLVITCSVAVAGALYAQEPAPTGTVAGPTHGGPAKPAAADDAKMGGQGGKHTHSDGSTQPGDAQTGSHKRHHRHHKKTETSTTESSTTGSAKSSTRSEHTTTNSSGPDASQSAAPNISPRSGGAVIHRTNEEGAANGATPAPTP